MSSDGPVRDLAVRQERAYQQHDAAGFAACFAHEVQFLAADGSLRLSGRTALHAAVAELFASHPDLRLTVAQRLVAGDRFVDHEVVEADGLGRREVLAVQRVSGGLIDEVRLLPLPSS